MPKSAAPRQLWLAPVWPLLSEVIVNPCSEIFNWHLCFFRLARHPSCSLWGFSPLWHWPWTLSRWAWLLPGRLVPGLASDVWGLPGTQADHYEVFPHPHSSLSELSGFGQSKVFLDWENRCAVDTVVLHWREVSGNIQKIYNLFFSQDIMCACLLDL